MGKTAGKKLRTLAASDAPAVGDIVHFEGEDCEIVLINGNVANVKGKTSTHLINVKDLVAFDDPNDAIDEEEKEWNTKAVTHPRFLQEIPKQVAAARKKLGDSDAAFYLPGRLLNPANHIDKTKKEG
jgi:hypothetical protein